MEAKTQTSPSSGPLTATLPNEWLLQCAHTDQALTITAYKLDVPTRLVEKYETLPERLKILAESLGDLATLLTTSNGITVQEKCLVIECKIGEKLKTLKIELKQEKIPEEDQIKNLQSLLEKEREQRLKEKENYEKTISQLKNEKSSEEYAKKRADERYNQLAKTYQQQKTLIQSLSLHYVHCAKWTCGKQLIIPMGVFKYPPIHKYGNKYICGKECQF